MNTSAIPAVAAVTLHFGAVSDTLECVDSLLAAGWPGLRIYVVNNDPVTAERDGLRGRLPAGVRLVEPGRNLGFSGGNNVGIRQALDDGADYVLLLNNDATVQPGALGELVRAAQAAPSVGIAGGKILQTAPGNAEPVIWSAGGWWSPWRATSYPIGIGELDRGQFDRAGETEFTPACLWLIPRKTLETVGLLPEEHFVYGEDVDYCLMVRGAGYRVWYEPRAVCHHRVTRSVWHDRSRASPLLNYYTNRNRVLIARKWLSPLQRLVFYAYFLTSRAVLALTRGDRSFLAGLRDGWRGVTGPRAG